MALKTFHSDTSSMITQYLLKIYSKQKEENSFSIAITLKIEVINLNIKDLKS